MVNTSRSVVATRLDSNFGPTWLLGVKGSELTPKYDDALSEDPTLAQS